MTLKSHDWLCNRCLEPLEDGDTITLWTPEGQKLLFHNRCYLKHLQQIDEEEEKLRMLKHRF